MGAWSFGPFENDDAADWLAEFNERTDHAVFVENTLRRIAASTEINADDESKAIAAAEVVAAMFGSPHKQFDSEILQPDQILSPSEHLRELARQVVTQIRDESELRALWDEAGPKKWLAEMNHLIDRLSKEKCLIPDSPHASVVLPLKKLKKAGCAMPPDGSLFWEHVSQGKVAEWNQLVKQRTDVDLGNLRLHNFNLKGICFAGVRLTGSELVGCNLENADFTGAHLDDANFAKARLSKATFNGSSLIRARFDHANMYSARFVLANARKASCMATDARKADFSRADLTETIWQAAYLQNATLKGANLCGADLRLAHFDEAVLTNANLKGANLGGAGLASAVLDGVNLEGTDCSVEDLRKSLNHLKLG